MFKPPALLILAAATLLTSIASAADPIRVYIRGGEKTHAPGAHEHEKFVAEWVPMLEARGAVCDGGLEFPSADQLAEIDVLVLNAKEAGNFAIGRERKNLLDYLKRGGGLVVIHAAAVSRDPDWYKTIIGGSWRFGTTKWLEAPMSLYFTDRANPITRDISNFDIDDEIYYDMDLLPEIEVLAAAYTPNAIDTKGRGNKEAQARAAEAVAERKGVNIYDIQPQVWSYENRIEGGSEDYRAFVSIPGHWHRNFDHDGIRTLILRGIAWAAKRDNVDELCKPEELGDALRYVEGGAPRPEELPEHLEVHPEFDLELVAAEPLINNPMNLTWDEQGRLWVVESPEYPNGLRQVNVESWKDSGSLKPGEYDRKPEDRISILHDRDGDGRMDDKTVFADEIELATGLVLHADGVIVSAAPDIWFFRDTDGDDVADERIRLYTNLGQRDTHAVINNLRWGRDGWVYATHGYSASSDVQSGDGKTSFGTIGSGVVRFKPDGSAFEQYASRNGNTWGLDLTPDGEVFYTQPTTGNPLVHVVLPEYVLAQGKLPGVSGTIGLLDGATTNPAMEWEHQAYVQIDQVGRYTAGAGCVIYRGGAWPEKWDSSYFTGEATVNLVGHFHVEPDGVTYAAGKEQGRENLEFIRSRNLWFRPIDTRIGPDGALYIVDFCNQAVIHNDTRGPTHGPANAAVRPDRDHYYGRIWRVQHKEAKELKDLPLDRKDVAALTQATESRNATVQSIAQRLLREAGEGGEQLVGSAAVREYEEALAVGGADELLERFAAAGDDWTRSALVAAGRSRAVEVVQAALKTPANKAAVAYVDALMPFALQDQGADLAQSLVQACAQAPSGTGDLRAAILSQVAAGVPELSKVSPETVEALKRLFGNGRLSGQTLSLVTLWGLQDALKAEVAQVTSALEKALNNGEAALPVRSRAAAALITTGGDSAQKAYALLSAADTPEALQKAVIAAADEQGAISGLVPLFGEVKSALQRPILEAVLKRPEATRSMLDAVSSGAVARNAFSPGDVARLRTHPNKQIAKRALDLFKIDTSAKDEIIAALAVEVEKPGDPERGKLLFTACAVCHKFGDSGIEVGPALDGMGAHGAAELLVHIIDPNREVDPSFWAHHISLESGEFLAGVITSENSASITLATQTGPREISKKDIAKRENTRRSLMPEGFEALGADALRDLLAYMVESADQGYRIVDLRDAYTGSSGAGVFASVDARDQTVALKETGDVTVNGVPFFIMDPRKSQTGANLIVLKGGGPKAYASSLPEKVEIPTDVEAASLHFLGGVGGWAWPYGGEKFLGQPAMTVEVEFADGDRQSFELNNGEHFADYIGIAEVPKSERLEGFTRRGQLRYFALNLKKKAALKKIVLKSGDNIVAPCTVAITVGTEKVAEATGAAPRKVSGAAPSGAAPSGAAPKGKGKGKGKAKSGPREPEPLPPTAVKWEEGKIKVLLIGGGSSHDFGAYFGKMDGQTLADAGMTVHYTEDRSQATELLATADVAVISVNRKFFDTEAYRRAVMDRVEAGKGVVMLHPGTWYGYKTWPELNATVVGGGSRGHDKLGPFTVHVKQPDHPITQGVASSFEVFDELYYMNAEGAPEGTAEIEVLLETSPSQKYGEPHPSVWITRHPKARLVGIALGHDEKTHGDKDFQTLLVNAVRWASGE